MGSEAFKAMDEWCQKQMQKLTPRAQSHVMRGGSTDDPEYRRLLGQHQAFMRMRSFIHGATKDTPDADT